ncbi:MAG: hypothetical protein RIF41_39430 [Polyangiaceae bacterium]
MDKGELMFVNSNLDLEHAVRNVEGTHATQRLAQGEVANGFPHTNAQTLVALWSLVETVVKDVTAGWLQAFPDKLTNDKLRKAKVPAVAFLKADDADRFSMLVDAAKGSEQGGSTGIDHLERMLKLASLRVVTGDDATEDDKRVRHTLNEICGLRNVIVHRGSVVDQKLLNDCPWLSQQMTTGQRVEIGLQELRGYASMGIWSYGVKLWARVHRELGLEPGLPFRRGSADDEEP